MASIFKRSKRKNEPYWIQYKDHLGKRKTAKGYTDKALTEQLAGKLESEARLRRTGMIDPQQERYAEVKQAALKVHLDAFAESLTDNSPKHCKLTMSRVKRIVEGCGFASLADIQPEAVQSFLRSLKKTNKISPRTYNHYIQAMDSFCNWCILTKRVLANPLLGLERLNTEVDIRHPRRALTVAEVGQLLASARDSQTTIFRVDGEQRARIYFLAYMTGLRKNELASLMPRSFDLDAEPPTVTVEARYSKHRRKDVLPLHLELVAELRKWFAEMAAGDKLFPKLAGKDTAQMVKHDLEKAGIAYRNEEGIADFHAAGRHTHITELVRSGASLPEVKELARHSDIKMTMKYTHISRADQARAVGNLPVPKANPKDQSPTALQMRCIPGVADSRRVASDGNGQSDENRSNPLHCKGLGTGCHRLSLRGREAQAGVEPALPA
ncbi:MAG: site-specific integrase [Thermoguttaceae bacterium]